MALLRLKSGVKPRNIVQFYDGVCFFVSTCLIAFQTLLRAGDLFSLIFLSYRRIKARRGHKKAIIAVCKMLLTAIWNILSKLVPYTPIGFLATPHTAASSRTLTISQALSLLRHRGFVLVDDPVPATP